MRPYWVWILGVALLLTACSKPQPPQRPSHRMGDPIGVDSAQLALMEMNAQMAHAADAELTRLAQQQEEPYALYHTNTWVHIFARGNENLPAPEDGEEWLVHMRIFDVKEHLLLDTEQTFRIGKRELPLGVDANIKELHPGGKARLLVPWYSAYGIQGTTEIAPYENLIIEIELR